MPDDTVILSLPMILPAQAQKHVTHNEALRLLDVMVQLAVQDRTQAAPPVGPAEGDRHIVAAGASGVWAGHVGEIALFAQGSWSFYTPLPGWRAWIAAEAAVATFDGAQWETLADGPLSVSQLGVSATADATNRLVVASSASLFTNTGAGHQLKLNKAASGDTASLLFQTGFSGRAEMGTAGSDNFAVRVSSDGSAWFDGISIAAASGIVSLPQGVSTAGFALRDASDPAKQAVFSASGLTSGSPRSYALPNVSSELAALSGTQTFTGVKSFSGSFAVSSASAQLGTSTASASYGIGTGATASGNTKTVDIATAGVSGSTTVLNLGSAVAGAGGSMVINSPSVTFANSVTSVAMPQAAVVASRIGLGGASADATNRLSVNAPGILFNHAGAGVETVLNKNAVGDDALLSFKTGFSTRALFGLGGSDDFSVKVSANGSSYTTALSVGAGNGVVTLGAPMVLAAGTSDPTSPVDGTLWHNATSGQIKAQVGGKTCNLTNQNDLPFLLPLVGDYLLTSSGFGSTVGTVVGAANRAELFPYLPNRSFAIDQVGANVITAVASALGKVVVYDSDEFGRPASLLSETANLDFSTVGFKYASLGLNFVQGATYWFGIRHSSTATLAAWQSYATPDINGGAPAVSSRKVLRRTLTYSNAAPATWAFASAEITSSNGCAIWMRRA